MAGTAVQPGKERSVPFGPGITASYCFYNFSPGNAPAVLVAVAELGSASKTLWNQYRQSEMSQSDFQEIGGVGDEAFYNDGNLHVRQGATGLILSVAKVGAPRGIEALDDIKRLAALVLPRV